MRYARPQGGGTGGGQGQHERPTEGHHEPKGEARFNVERVKSHPACAKPRVERKGYVQSGGPQSGMTVPEARSAYGRSRCLAGKALC